MQLPFNVRYEFCHLQKMPYGTLKSTSVSYTADNPLLPDESLEDL